MGASEVWFPEKLQPLFRPARYKVIYGGRGKGGSWGMARALLLQGFQKPLRILCAREIQRTIRDSVHQLLSDQVSGLGLSWFYKPTETEIVGRNGTIFSFTGLRQLDARKIKSFEGYDRAWVEEAESISHKSWEILIPTIRKEDSEIWVNLNPQMDSDPTYVRFVEKSPPDAVLMPMSWRDNPWFPEVLEKERKYLEANDPVAYANVWDGKCRTTVEGAIYGAEVTDLIESKRVRPVPYEPLLKVHTVWDLGWNDSMSIGFVQRVASEIRWIDFLEDDHKTYDWYVQEIKNRRYNLGSHFLPHDGFHANPQTGISPEMAIRKLGLTPCLASRTADDVENGIKAVRLHFRQMYFDEVKCKPLVDHLRRYKRNIPTTTNEPQRPLHDEHSHAADMVREAIRRLPEMRNDEKDKPLPLPKTGIV